MNMTFILTMPGCGSWNGKWSGEGNLYAAVVKVGAKKARELNGKSFDYSWSDGWRARVECKLLKGAELRQVRKNTKGFCGYEWMINSIRFYGKIMTDAEVQEMREREAALRPVPVAVAVPVVVDADCPF